MNTITTDSTVGEAKQSIRDNFREGTSCPCCGQFVKLYKRKLAGGTGACLIRLHRLSNRGKYFHIHEISGKSKALTVHISGGDFAKASYWGLIEAMPNDDTTKRCSGFWKITNKGRDFVNGVIGIESYALVYNSKCLGTEGEPVYIKDVLGKKFNYEELMSRQ